MKDMFDYYDDFVKEKSESNNGDSADEVDDIKLQLDLLASKIEEIARRINNDGTDC